MGVVVHLPPVLLWLFDVGMTTYAIQARDEVGARLVLSARFPDLKPEDVRNVRTVQRVRREVTKHG